MDKIGPKEAADTIRDEFLHEQVDPRFHHQVRFARDVLSELAQDKTIESTAKVMRLLTKHNIEGHAYADYPKWVTNERGERAVVNDEDHEAAFMARPESHVDGVPNAEHGHVDPQTGVFVAGMKPVVYDHDDFGATTDPHFHHADMDAVAADRNRDAAAQNAEFIASLGQSVRTINEGAAHEVDSQRGEADKAATANQTAQQPVANLTRAQQIKAEQDRLAAAEKDAQAERDRLAALQKEST